MADEKVEPGPVPQGYYALPDVVKVVIEADAEAVKAGMTAKPQPAELQRLTACRALRAVLQEYLCRSVSQGALVDYVSLGDALRFAREFEPGFAGKNYVADLIRRVMDANAKDGKAEV